MSSSQEKAQHSVLLAQATVESLSAIKETILSLSEESQRTAQLVGHAEQEVTSVHRQVDDFKELGASVAAGSGETQAAAEALSSLSPA